MRWFIEVILFFQFLSNPHYENDKFLKKAIILFYSNIGLAHTMVEIFSYIILYHYIATHNNTNMQQILAQSEIKARNNVNAISLTGLVMGWLMEVWYVIAGGFLGYVLDRNMLREVSSILKFYEFYFIPLVQIHTSAPLKRFRINSKKC
jgi:hypothetical protein